MKFNLDEELRLNKAREVPSMTIVLRAVFHDKYYPQVFLAECLYEI